MSEVRDVLRSRCEHARARGVESLEVDVEALQRLITEGDHLEALRDTAENDVLALVDELEQERNRG